MDTAREDVPWPVQQPVESGPASSKRKDPFLYAQSPIECQKAFIARLKKKAQYQCNDQGRNEGNILIPVYCLHFTPPLG